MLKVKIAPSILAADFSNLEREVKRADRGGADYIHVDVMDGQFVPNLTIGMPVVAGIRPHTNKPLDVHLMIQEPLRYIRRFREAGADIITVHAEACGGSLRKTLREIKKSGAKAGVALKPHSSLRTIIKHLSSADMVLLMTVEPGFGGQKFNDKVLPKIRQLRGIFKKDIEVDGGINAHTIALAAAAGANVFVAGASVYGHKDIGKAIHVLKRAATLE